ncbi:hypothetical protein [Rhodoferax sp.]|uniref:hypothetical protein n=1 Tax=Rhodoferax sp. TaxID=50421 RepID=UPI00374D24C4
MEAFFYGRLRGCHFANLFNPAPQIDVGFVDEQAHRPTASGAALYRVHAGFQSDLDFARQASAKSTGYAIGRAEDVPHVMTEF